MKAAIITIGDEILIGQIVDTNSAWIARKLNEAGVRVDNRLSVGDQPDAIRNAVAEAMEACDVVITTGGLGPTKDDITKHVLAEMFGCGMREDRATFLHIEETARRRGFDFNALNRAQAMVPEACTVLPNPNGTAPGMWFEKASSVLVSLPGVPFEMEALMEQQVIPRLRQRFDMKAIVHKTALTYGIAESVLAERIAAWEDALPEELHLAYLPSPSGVKLRLSAYDIDGQDETEIIDRQFGMLEQIIPGAIFGYGEGSMQEGVANALTKAGKTLSVAESCTGGYIASLFTAMPGASAYFIGGIVAYGDDVKVNMLGVDPAALRECGAVSERVAVQMAEGARRATGSDYAVATTGVAGPTGGTEEKPIGTVWIAVASAEKTVARKFVFGALRKVNIERASAAAVNMLREVLAD